MLIAILAGQRGVRAFVGAGMLLALTVFSIVFLAAEFRHPNGIGCGLQFGGDYLLFHASGRMILAGRGHQLYDLENLKDVQQELFGQPLSNCLGTDTPVAYLPVFLVPYTVFSLLSPLAGFLTANVVSVAIFALTFWRLARFSEQPVWVLWLFSLGSFPILLGMNYGQVHGLLMLALTEFQIALGQRRDTRAGIWLALLLVKYQFLPVFFLFLVWQRLWRALGAFLLASFVLFVGSVSMIGWEGFRRYVGYLASVARVNADEIGAWLMVSWRAFALNWLPIESNLGMAVATVLLSLLTIGVTLASWAWGRGDLTARDRLPLTLFGLGSTALLVGYDTSIDSTVLVFAPAMALAASYSNKAASVPPLGAWVLDLVMVIPSLVFMAQVLASRNAVLGWFVASQVMITGLVVAVAWAAAASTGWAREGRHAGALVAPDSV